MYFNSEEEKKEKVAKIRSDWGKSDSIRDDGLSTPEDMVRFDNLSYGPYGDWNLLDIYYTKDAEGIQPTIINVHGGGWVYGSKEVYQYYCMNLAKRGFTVVNFNYRLAPEYNYPSPLYDINQVLCFVKEHAAKYLIDTEKLFLMGDSAGGQLLAQYLTIYSNKSYAKMFDFKVPDVTIRAAAHNCGHYDMKSEILSQDNELFEIYIESEVLKEIYKSKEVPLSLHTLEHITSDFPPAFVMTAYHDFNREPSKLFYKHLKEIGVDCEFKEYGGEEQKEIAHVFHVNCKTEEAKKCNDDECAFFKKFI